MHQRVFLYHTLDHRGTTQFTRMRLRGRGLTSLPHLNSDILVRCLTFTGSNAATRSFTYAHMIRSLYCHHVSRCMAKSAVATMTHAATHSLMTMALHQPNSKSTNTHDTHVDFKISSSLPYKGLVDGLLLHTSH
ncbi:hypothetical protein AMTR_s00144p00086380 [Amborella trichopoda]|uniref:Uncharacterized protein n=1 Tax=Amborella trichopoda TaxID=13333 RepID=W1P1I4_AMBTC|nr:hypothetical protein AMTR_s00144p00086380 [Amborella trichopoda]